MRCLYCEKDEAIVVGDNVIVRVVEIEGDTVQLGIEVPDETSFLEEAAKHAGGSLMEEADSRW